MLVAAGEVDLAIGGDQGGSIRMPASFCGVYGMKPTHGLVPYTGVMPIEATIDHWPDYGDRRRQRADAGSSGGAGRPRPAPVCAEGGRLFGCDQARRKGLKIGVVKEEFGHANSEKDVDASVREAAKRFKALGARVEEVSIPEHLIAPAIWTPIALEGLQAQMMLGNGMGFNWKGLYTVSLLDAHANWRYMADDLSDSLKISMMVGQYFITHYRGRFYAKAQNLARRIRGSYDKAVDTYDLVLMPTRKVKATALPPAEAPLGLYLQRAFEMIGNTKPFDVTGHPAMSIPCGLGDGLPIGSHADRQAFR